MYRETETYTLFEFTDLSQLDLVIDKGKSVSQISPDAVYRQNGSFGWKDNKGIYHPLGYIIKDGKLINDTVDCADWYAFIVTKNGQAHISKINRNNISHIQLAWQGTPKLLENGKLTNLKSQTVPSDVYGEDIRSAIGIKEDSTIGLIKTKKPVTLYYLAELMQSLGYKEVLNMDGGFSATKNYKGEPHGYERPVSSAIVVKKEGEKMPKIAISIGHGENTFDEKGSKGLYYMEDGERKKFEEHDDFNAHVGKMVIEELRNYPIDVLVVQEPFAKDKPLEKRTAEANTWRADLYWSIHANYNRKEHVEGICAWYAKGFDKPKKLAEQFIKNVKDAGLPTHGIGTHASDEDPNTWEIRLWELWETSMTAVLTENGFFSNPDTRKKMLTQEYRKQIADVHVKTILEHFGIEQKKPENNDDKYNNLLNKYNNLLNDLHSLIDKYKQ